MHIRGSIIILPTLLVLTDESINTWALSMKNALLRREGCNVISVDWSRGAKFPYGQATGNTRLVGAQTAELIRFLISSSSGSPNRLIDRFYIVGFSLGAHVAGYAGSYLRARGMKLARVTGLDPAGLYFTTVSSDFRLDETDASYVDVIHTDAGVLGTNRRDGDVDFYPNGGSGQPGCLFKFPCDHMMRAPEYYTASVQASCSWTAYPCVNYATFEQRKCQVCDGACPSMGFDADRTKKEGKFFLKTNSKAPFCGKTR